MIEKEKPLTVSTIIFGSSFIFYILGIVFPIATTSETVVNETNLESTTITVLDILSSTGVLMLLTSIFLVIWGTYWVYSGKSGFIFGILAFILGVLPADVSDDFGKFDKIDPGATSSDFGVIALWIAILLALAGGIVSKYIKK